MPGYIGFIRNENGELKRKYIREEDVGKDPNVLYQLSELFGDYAWTDEEHMEETKEALLESMINKIRALAKLDMFWIVKKEADYRDAAQNDPVREIQGASEEEFIPQEAKEGRATIAWKIILPTFGEGYYPFEVRERLKKEIEACLGSKYF